MSDTGEQPITARILWVGPDDLLARAGGLMGRAGWESSAAAAPVAAIKRLRAEGGIDVIVMVPGPELSAFSEACRNIKFDGRMKVAVAFLLDDIHAARACDLLECGADECILLSAPAREIFLRLRNAIHVKQATDSMENASVMILSLARAIEGKDVYTCGHVERVGVYSVEIGRKLGLSESDLEALRVGGIVHDIGKVGIPDHVLNKPGKLSEEEFAVIKRHPMIGYDILRPMRTFANVLPIVRWHHEKPSGKGYPDGLKGKEIPVLARISAVADWFDALITDRPYRKAFPVPECLRMLRQAVAAGDLDGDVVEAMCDIMTSELGASMAALASNAAIAA
ncbi:MAG TPA: HD-GYP domain-containing protein [Tepidisphaeraceae bacterium]|nr:HD-GYP domain-containing protein [Tepidisphaeraceae bacterium]